MSGWKNVLKKKSMATLVFALVTALVSTAAGALVITAGLWPIDRTWIWICLAWGITGFLSCRFVTADGTVGILQVAIHLAILVAVMWLLGYFVAGEGSGSTTYWVWYMVSGLVGTLVALFFLPKRKQRKKRKIASYRPQKR